MNIRSKAKVLITILAFIFGGMFLLTSCEDEKPADPATIQLDKHGAIEMKISTSHHDSIDVLKVEKIVYNKNGVIVNSRFFLDTMKSLGMMKDTFNTGRTYTDSDGNEHELDTIVSHPRNYQIYVTVK